MANLILLLQTVSLKKYRKLHDMDDLPPGASREDMIPAVAKHFSQQVGVFFKHYKIRRQC